MDRKFVISKLITTFYHRWCYEIKILIIIGSGRSRNHYPWLLTQSYSAIPKNVRRQTKVIFVWYSKERADVKDVAL